MNVYRAIFTCLIAIGLWSTTAQSYSSGPLDGYAGDPPSYNNCTACHNFYPVNSGPGIILMVTPPASYVSGSTIPVDISVADPTAMRWGFEMTALNPSGNAAGQFIIIDQVMTQLSDNPGTSPDYVKHTTAGTFAGTPLGVAWPILWQAPIGAGPVTFYFAGNAADNTGTPAFDFIYTDSLVVNAAFPVYVDLTPPDTTTFPAAGGTLNYNIALTSVSTITETVDIWVDVTLPSGAVAGPVLGPVLNFNVPPMFSANRDRTLGIPPGAPAGNYMLNGYIGVYDSVNPVIYAEDHFPFDKTAMIGTGAGMADWFVDSGESFADLVPNANTPAEYILSRTHPNPFNPTTTIEFTLPEGTQVTLSVYDLSGRLVATLADGWRDAGRHEITFDASGLPSGVYLYRLNTGKFYTGGKMVLMK